MADFGTSPRATISADRELAVGAAPIFRKLKPGPGLPAEQVLADQRRRIQAALIAMVDETGRGDLKVRSLVRTAGISTATFYKHFANVNDCLASTYDEVMRKVLLRSSAAQQCESDWPESLRAAIGGLLNDLASEPRAARLVLLDIFAAGPNARRHIGRAVGELEQQLTESFAMAPPAMRPPRHLIAGMAAGVLRIARTTTAAGRSEELPRMARELGDWMLALPNPKVLSLQTAEPDQPTPGTRREPRPFPAEDALNCEPSPETDRDRLLRAAIKLAAVEGFAGLTVSRLRIEAGVSRKRYDACFDSLNDCFLGAFETVAEEAARRAQRWSETDTGWRRQTCRYVLALCAQMARDRTLARLAFLGVFATGSPGLAQRERMIGRMAVNLITTVPAECRPSLVFAEASAAAAWHIAETDLAARRTRGLPTIAPLLSYVVLAPIVGAHTASVAIKNELGAVPIPTTGCG